jgi:hypothetical protein
MELLMGSLNGWLGPLLLMELLMGLLNSWLDSLLLIELLIKAGPAIKQAPLY